MARRHPSHTAAETPGSIHEGGELGYSLLHAFGAVLDNLELIAFCVVGDGEAETGPCAASWHSNKFINPDTDGVVIPILHLNGYKIASATLLARIPKQEPMNLFLGYGYETYFVEGDDPHVMHQTMAETLDRIWVRVRAIQQEERNSQRARPMWPMMILRTPKGWTCPKTVDGLPVEDSFRSHQVPISKLRERPDHLRLLENWMHSYRPEELFDSNGALLADLMDLPPKGIRLMGMNPHTNGGAVLRELQLPDFRMYAVDVHRPGFLDAESTQVLGKFLRDVVRLNKTSRNFRIMGPDEKADVVRVYLPPDANTLLSVADHCLRSKNYVNVIVAGKQPQPQWLGIEEAVRHCAVGLGVWRWASNDNGTDPDVVMVGPGDVPTLEILAARSLLRTHLPDMRVRVVNVVDLMTLQAPIQHPHGLDDQDFDEIFTTTRPTIFAYHGYPALIHRLTYRRTNHRNLHVHGYREEGTTTRGNHDNSIRHGRLERSRSVPPRHGCDS